MDPRVVDALTIVSLAAGPEVSGPVWVVRTYVRMQALQLIDAQIATQGAAREVKQKLPRELTQKARAPSAQELRKHLETAVADGAERGLRQAGRRVTRHGNRLTVRE